MSFAHLHVHTEYSMLDGFSNIKKLVKRVQELNMPAVAITDHGTMWVEGLYLTDVPGAEQWAKRAEAAGFSALSM